MRKKLCYGAGDIYGGGAFMVFSLFYMNFLTLVEGVPVGSATLIILIGKLWDAVTDPMVGRLSDKTKSRFGRRRFFFLIGILPVMLSFIMLFYSFGIENMTAKIIYHAFAYMFFGTAFTIVMVPYNAILSDITDDYNERTVYTTVRMMISGAASLVCAILPGIIIKSVGGAVNGESQRPGYFIMALILGIVFGVAWLIVFAGTKEKKNPEIVERVTLKDWAGVFKNKTYRNFLGMFLTFQVAVDLVLAIFIFYVDLVVLKYQYYEVMVGLLLIFQVIFMTVHSALAQKKGKAFPILIGLPIWIITSLCFIGIDNTTPVWILCVLSVLTAVGSSAGNLSTWSMLADIYDVDEIVTGKRREGLYSGVTTFARKAASGLAVFILGMSLNQMGFDKDNYNYIKSTAANFNPADYASADLVFGIKWMYIIIPIVLCVLCLIFAVRNKINKQRFDAVLKGIEQFKTYGNIDRLDADVIADIETATGVKKDKLWDRGTKIQKL